MQTLHKLMQTHLVEGGVIVPGGRDMHLEIREKATGMLWMSLNPVTAKDFSELQLCSDYEPFGTGIASMDSALFQHSPNAEGELVRERTIGGHRCINVAEPGAIKFSDEAPGMAEVLVNKAHVIGFEAGREVTFLTMPDGDFIETVGTPERDQQLSLPANARLQKIVLSEPLIVHLPTPTRTLWWFGKSPRSFQGPVALAQIP